MMAAAFSPKAEAPIFRFVIVPLEFDEALQSLLNHLTDNWWWEVFLRVTERLQKTDYILRLGN